MAPETTPDPTGTKRRTAYRTCPLCEATCGVAIEVEGDRVVRVRGDKQDPFSRGFICPKGSTLGELHHDPDRLRTPLVRRDGRLEEATWEEAFEEIERRLGGFFEEHSRQSLALLLGNPIVHHLSTSLYVRPFVLAAGSFNLYSASTLDQMPQHLVSGLLWGDPSVFPLPDIDRTDHLLMLGANPMASNGSLVTAPDFPGRLKAMPARGARLVVVDPRRTETAARADEHLFIRPGTDVFWLAALVHTLFEEDRVSIGRLEPWVEGVDEIRDLVADFTPERVAPICGIDAETTRRQARQLVNAAAGAVYGRMGAHTVEFGAATAWMTAILNILTGNFDRPGGVMTASPVASRIDDREPGGRGFQTGRWKSRVKGHPEVNGEFPAAGLADEMETPGEGQVRAVITVASNPVRSYPNSERLDRAFAALDFHLALDIYVNETTRHADVILPPPSGLEEEQYELTFMANAVRSFAKFSPPVFERQGPSEEDIFARLILILRGQGAAADVDAVHEEVVAEAVDRLLKDANSPIAGRGRDDILAELEGLSPVARQLDLRLRTGWQGDLFGANPGGVSLAKLAKHPHGVDLGPMVERFPARLKTKSGRFELAPKQLVEDWARVRARLEDPVVPGRLLLIGRRHVRSNNSWMHNIGTLVKGRSRCTLMMNPEDAGRLGLSTGGMAEVTSRVGKLRVEVETTEAMMPGVVSLPHGWGHDVEGVRLSVASAHPGVPSNALIDDEVIDTASGNAVLNAIPVEVTPATA
ncbi:MAG TPA: molybdopterin oxidoreductase family protein [Deltaproteobacteria bacterium]|nr:molybdopterin oxidoreductase family protein [Deltaproteobacteria bacterium]